MISWLKSLFSCKEKEPEHNFQEVIPEYWYCGKWYSFRCKMSDLGFEDRNKLPVFGFNQYLFNPYRVESLPLIGYGADIDIDGLIPVNCINDEVGLYEIVAHQPPRNHFYDGTSFDNGYTVYLELKKIIHYDEIIDIYKNRGIDVSEYDKIKELLENE